MLLESALKAMAKHREVLLEQGSTSNPSLISEHTYRLAQYIGVAEERLADLESELEIKESRSFHEHVKQGKSVNAAKEAVRREFTEDRAKIAKVSRLVASALKIVSASQSRVKHLIAEANNQF